MFLYHGTSLTALKNILTSGIQARNTTSNKSVWDVESAKDRVYLTDTYAAYFALVAAMENESDDDAVIIKVKVDENSLLPDEDYLAQRYPRTDNLIKDTEYYRDYLLTIYNRPELSVLAEESLRHLGTVATKTVLLENIVSYTVIPNSEIVAFMLRECDPSITLTNHKFCSGHYKNQLETLPSQFVTTTL